MGEADQRVAELLERWRSSLELHARYLALDDAAYARVQDWPKHQRPTRWVIDLARQRLHELERLLADRRSRGDPGFGEALELMGFLTNLLGSEHLERFIPLALPPGPGGEALPPAATDAGAATRKPVPLVPSPNAAARRAGAGRPAGDDSRTVRKAPSPPRRDEPPAAAAPRPPALSDAAVATVIADAVRLLRWGREWPQLAGLIARLADRPSEAEVWSILRGNRAVIEAEARRIPG